MTTQPTALEVETVPFSRVLVPYDGSAQSQTALAYGIALAHRGAVLDIVNVVNDSPVYAESSTSVVMFDPTPLIDALDKQADVVVGDAEARCREAGVEAQTHVLHDFSVSGIDRVAEDNHDDLIVLGTHGRSGLPRTFLGSTTEGVLRSSRTAVLSVHADMAPPARLFSKILVAIDDSEPSDAAVALAARIARTTGASAVIYSSLDVSDVLEKAGSFGYDPVPLLDELRDSAEHVVDRAVTHGGFPMGTAVPSVVKSEPAKGIIEEAVRAGADLIVMGSHGRRGLQRLFLGSVAEHVVRHSPVPVLVVRVPPAL